MNTAHWECRRQQEADSEVLVCDDQPQGSARLYGDARCLASALIDLGLRPGTPVAIALPNSYELFVAFSATLLAGGVLVVLGDVAEGSLRGSISHCKPGVLITQKLISGDGIRGSLVLTTSETSDVTHSYSMADLISDSDPIVSPVARSGADLAQLCYTSGTSGKLKAVEYAHSSLDSFRAARASTGSEIGTLLLAVPPSAFSSRFLLAHVVSGQKYVLLQDFEPMQVLYAIERWHVSEVPIVPAMARRILAWTPDRQIDCRSLKAINIAGAQVSETLVSKLRGWFQHYCATGNLEIVVNYGSTEAGGGITSSGRAHGRCVGRPLRGVTVRIVDDAGNELPDGETGEVVVSTPYSGSAYWGEPELSQRVFCDGLVRTGDLGYLSNSHELFLVGRISDMIIQGGVNIDPLEVSAVIEDLDGVRECAVVGIEDDFLGEQVVACVVPTAAGDTNGRDIRRICRESLDHRKLPTLVIFFESLPKTETGKVRTGLLKESVLNRLGALQNENRECVFDAPDRHATTESLELLVRSALAEVITLYPTGQAFEDSTSFGDMGLDSIGAVQFSHVLGANLGIRVPPIIAFAEPTIPALVRWLEDRLEDRLDVQADPA